MRNKLRVGIIFGGRSGEHEVSIVSASSVISAIDKTKYKVIPIGITKQGVWITNADPITFLKKGVNKNTKSQSIILPDATRPGLIDLQKNILSKKIDVVFPLLHGPFGEDGTIQGLFELANLPYVGSDVLGSSIAMDKVIQKQICRHLNIPTVPYEYFMYNDYTVDKQATIKKCEKLGYPLFIKPANLGSSVGITKAHNKKELRNSITLAASYDNKIIVEKSIEPNHEIEVAILGNTKPRASVPGEIVASNEFYDYNAKYVDGKSYHKIPAPLPKTVQTAIRTIAKKAFLALNCSGMARVDFLVAKGSHRIYLNEVNTIPGFTSISMYAKLWAASGIPYVTLLDRLISLALENHRQKNKLKASFKPKTNWYK